jgi:acetate---CoA ligase (ADP-forming)
MLVQQNIAEHTMDFSKSKAQVAALTAPRNAVLVGASDRPGSWAARVWRNLNQYKFPGPLYLLNPRRNDVFGQPCYSDFAALPEPPDHLVVLVPAPAVANLLRRGAAAGARSATVFSAGFGEGDDPAGVRAREELAAIIAETGLAVSGPNCMGNVCAKSRLVTLTEDRPLALNTGPVALVGQSGGVMIFLNHTLWERGIGAQYLITSGNEIGLGVPDYITFFAGDPELKVIIFYVDAVADVERFKAACRLARAAGKTLIALKLGQSEAGREAAMAHTGALAGSIAVFDAVCADVGVIRADTLDDVIELTELLVHTGAPRGSRLGAITLSGAYRGLLLDAAERNGLSFPPLAAETVGKLKKVLSVGSLIGNPIDGGFGVLTSAETYQACIDALQEDPNVDTVLLQEALPREPGSDRSENYIKLVENSAATTTKKPIAFVTLVSHSQTDYSRALRRSVGRVSFLQEANKALRAVAAVVRRDASERLAGPASADPPSAQMCEAAKRVRAAMAGANGKLALNEAVSKEILKAYGIASAPQALVQSPKAALDAAQRIGYPVVIKAVSERLLHKSDAGAVILDCRNADDVGAAFARIRRNLAEHGFTGALDGMLVCKQICGGTELALGVTRDPEMGLAVMVGAGGVLLELLKDVAFGVPPISPEKARDMLAQTRVGRLMQGYRGGPALDVEAVVGALVALGRLAVDLADVIDSVDVNPFTAMPQGAVALDGLIVLQQQQSQRERPAAG